MGDDVLQKGDGSLTGTVCPFCAAADPKWPERYMVPTVTDSQGVERPSQRYRNLVRVTCLECGAGPADECAALCACEGGQDDREREFAKLLDVELQDK